ncbi:indolepyruvate oxidoreductase subunit beta family protein [Pararhizobium mangrovi]|uniref:Indolepyruvate oxidoreductase subunit beta family protein n=1 Tax=Pararhizobium mangrovi TaxID=2590452 RepID=A0A506U757_9HYPH|nr:indolepyruvate oxidoreductase subunit beta family protein [Pararhizobium mangrovi]TPW30203.1 indolepyruvate oxidoreductase subunit beta family protein [Pararhizobium mangrovi]
MNTHVRETADLKADERVLSIAILAVGGQGGGVLTSWVTDVAERNGYRAQSTSVAGVAQRTGATIYYIEMCPDDGRQPVLSLSPAENDVDILIAAELMEAGRAIMRGFVTPDRTTLIASAHRIAAVSEKIVPGDGRGSAEEVHASARRAAKNYVSFDMEKMAVEAGSVISSSLFGALAGCGVLPFGRESFEETIRASGRGVEASLRAFGKAYDEAHGDGHSEATGAPEKAPERTVDTHLPLGGQPESEDPDPRAGKNGEAGPQEMGRRAAGHSGEVAAWQGLVERIDAMPEPVRAMARHGSESVVDFQDTRYGSAYLDRVEEALRADSADRGYAFAEAAAKYLANAMCYDDIIRVADLKTRSTRSARVRREVGVDDETVLHVTEYFHPRLEEFCGTMPAGFGRWIEGRPGVSRWLSKRLDKGRHIRTDGMGGFAMLWTIAGLRRWRRGLLRHTVETAHIDDWWSLAMRTRERDYDLGVEVLRCRRLIKGYSDTHERGLSKFDRVLSALPMLEGRDDAAPWLGRLREAALKDEKGIMLDGALETVASFAGEPDNTTQAGI